jgi:hypothetical protein
MANGGYKKEVTDREFSFPGAAEEHCQRLCEPRASESKFTAPYYQRGELWTRLQRGEACVVNAVAYRSKTVDSEVRKVARNLPPARKRAREVSARHGIQVNGHMS